MTEVVTDLNELKDTWTPKQTENWEHHGAPLFERLETLPMVVDGNGGDGSSVDVGLAKEWYLRTYRPKKRGDGMMKHDHVKIGTPEYYMTKFMGKLGNAWGSIQGLVMAQFGIDKETQDKAEEAATIIFTARNLDNKQGLAHVIEEHKKVGELYGV
jgi:hypothetical protein